MVLKRGMRHAVTVILIYSSLPLYELELKTGISISPMVMLKKLWENRPFKTPFYINVTNEGIVL